MTLNIILLT